MTNGKVRIRILYETNEAKVLLVLLPGQQPDALNILADQLAQQFPQALIANVEIEQGALNLAVVMQCLRHLQHMAQIEPAATALFGFAEQAGVALESLNETDAPSRAFVIAPLQNLTTPLMPNHCTAHFFAFTEQLSAPGDGDSALTVYQKLKLQQADVSFVDLGELELSDCWAQIVNQLATYVPKHYFDEAQPARGN
jgi:hypothetical protein